VETVKKLIWRIIVGKKTPYKYFPLKPFDCSLCMTHHTLVIWALITGNFSVYIYMVICILSFLSSNITGFLRLIKDMLIKAENKIGDILC
jgi:hypothetical protein